MRRTVALLQVPDNISRAYIPWTLDCEVFTHGEDGEIINATTMTDLAFEELYTVVCDLQLLLYEQQVTLPH